MAEEKKSHEYEAKVVREEGSVETQDRGLFDFLGKKEEEKKSDYHQEVAISGEFHDKVKVSEAEPAYVHHEEPKHHHEEPKYKVEEEEKEKKPSLLEKLHRSGSSSSSSSDEEDEEKKKKKKEKKKGLKEKILGHKEEEEKEEEHHHDTNIPISYEEGHPEEKKGFLEKIKEKLPGQHKKEEVPPPPAPPAAHTHEHSEGSAEVSQYQEGGETKEKKGILEKIKEKLPGYHSKSEDEKEKEKEKEKESGYGH